MNAGDTMFEPDERSSRGYTLQSKIGVSIYNVIDISREIG